MKSALPTVLDFYQNFTVYQTLVPGLQPEIPALKEDSYNKFNLQNYFRQDHIDLKNGFHIDLMLESTLPRPMLSSIGATRNT